jgi:hypothetical protein
VPTMHVSASATPSSDAHGMRKKRSRVKHDISTGQRGQVVEISSAQGTGGWRLHRVPRIPKRCKLSSCSRETELPLHKTKFIIRKFSTTGLFSHQADCHTATGRQAHINLVAGRNTPSFDLISRGVSAVVRICGIFINVSGVSFSWL